MMGSASSAAAGARAAAKKARASADAARSHRAVLTGVAPAAGSGASSNESSHPEATRKRSKEPLTALSWNMAAINNNPFEYWITHDDDPRYDRMMRAVRLFIEEDEVGPILRGGPQLSRCHSA